MPTSASSGSPVASSTGVDVTSSEMFRAFDGTWRIPGFALFTKFVAAKVVTLTDGANISIDASTGNIFIVTLGGNRTLSNPTNATDGQVIRIRVIQDGTGSRILSYGTAYNFGAAGSPTLTTTASATDILGFEYSLAKGQWLYLGASLGF